MRTDSPTPPQRIPGEGSREPLFYRFEARIETAPIGLVPDGVRVTVSFDGHVTRGEFPGARVWGIDPLLIRTDGVGLIDAHKTISEGERHHYEHIQAYCLPPEGFEPPPPEVMLDPGFTWPDVDFPIVGFSTFQTADPERAWLNRAFAQVEGAANYATGRLVIETRLARYGRSGKAAVPEAVSAAS